MRQKKWIWEEIVCGCFLITDVFVLTQEETPGVKFNPGHAGGITSHSWSCKCLTTITSKTSMNWVTTWERWQETYQDVSKTAAVPRILFSNKFTSCLLKIFLHQAARLMQQPLGRSLRTSHTVNHNSSVFYCISTISPLPHLISCLEGIQWHRVYYPQSLTQLCPGPLNQHILDSGLINGIYESWFHRSSIGGLLHPFLFS